MTRGAQTKRRKNAAGDNITISCGNKAVCTAFLGLGTI